MSIILFHLLSLSNACPVSSNSLVFFRYFTIVSYTEHLGQVWPIIDVFPVNLFSVTSFMSEPSARQTCPAHSNLFLSKNDSIYIYAIGSLYSCHRFSLVLLWKLPKSLLYNGPYIFLSIFLSKPCSPYPHETQLTILQP